MAKITTIIDIGSNSARMAIFQKTSRYGFHLIYELKSKVRISEGSYEHNSYLQEPAIHRALLCLKEFKKISDSFKSKKLLCVATSALRDAPNKADVIARIKKECGIHVKVIEGNKEAQYGAIACANLLHKKSGITIDIGGGSTELAYIADGQIQKTISLNLGSIRLKELFFDRNQTTQAYEYVQQYINENLSEFKEFYNHSNSKQETYIFGIGGSIRAYAKYELLAHEHGIKFLHGYELDAEKSIANLHSIISSSYKELRSYGFDEARLDSIRPGLLVLQVLLTELHATKLIISGVGVREGVFLSDMLRNHNYKIPNNINPSLRFLQDTFSSNTKLTQHKIRHIRTIFNLLKTQYKLKDKYLYQLEIAAKLSDIGSNLNFYQQQKHCAYIALHSLIYGFSHKARYTIATLLEYSQKKRPKSANNPSLLPSHDTLQLLSFILAIGINITQHERLEIKFHHNRLAVYTDSVVTKQILQDINLPKFQDTLPFEFTVELK